MKIQTDIIVQATEFDTLKINFHGWQEKLMMGFGWTCSSDETLVAEGWGELKAKSPSSACPHHAQWMALKSAIDFVLNRGISYESFSVEGDSRLVINQAIGFTHLYKNKAYSETAKECLTTIERIPYKKPIFHWIPLEKNEYCALLSRRNIKEKVIGIRAKLNMSA